MRILSDAFIPPIAPARTKSVRLRFDLEDEPSKLTLDEFWEFCSQNRKLFVELHKNGELRIVFPRGFKLNQKSVEILVQLHKWSDESGTGVVFNSLVGFALPDGSVFSPTFSCISRQSFESLTEEKN